MPGNPLGWCAWDSEGRCALAENRPLAEDEFDAVTLCGRVVRLPAGSAFASPDCDACWRALLSLRNRRVLDNLGLVGDLARRLGRDRLLRTYGSYDDAFQEGCLGLVYAADRFDPSRGFQFSTYAGRCVFGFLRRGANWLREGARRKWAGTGFRGGMFEIAETDWVRCGPGTSRTNEREGAGLDSLPLPEDESRRREEAAEAARVGVWKALERLPERERRIVLGRIGGRTLEQLGEEEGISRERIRQLEARAHQKLGRRLRELLGVEGIAAVASE